MRVDLSVACPPSRQRLATRAQLRAAGVTRQLLDTALARGDLVRVRRGVYSTGRLPPVGPHLLSDGAFDLGYLAHVRAVLLELGVDVVAAGRSAAFLWGFDMLVEPTGVEVARPPGTRAARDGVTVTVLETITTVMRRIKGLEPVPVLSAVQTLVHCALVLPLQEAVVIVDSAFRNQTVSRKVFATAVAARAGSPGARRLRKVLAWSCTKSGSVLETLFRLLVMAAGLGRPTPQYFVRDGRRVLARVDFCWEQHRLVVECDGRRWHDPEDARTRDRRRDNGLERLSWRVLRFTWRDVVHDPDYVIAEVRACLQGWMSAA